MPELAPVTMAIFPLSDWVMRRSLLIDDRRRQSKLKAFSVQRSAFSVQRSAFSVQRSPLSVSAFSVMKVASQATIRRPLAGRALAVQRSHLFCRVSFARYETSGYSAVDVR